MVSDALDLTLETNMVKFRDGPWILIIIPSTLTQGLAKYFRNSVVFTGMSRFGEPQSNVPNHELSRSSLSHMTPK